MGIKVLHFLLTFCNAEFGSVWLFWALQGKRGVIAIVCIYLNFVKNAPNSSRKLFTFFSIVIDCASMLASEDSASCKNTLFTSILCVIESFGER